MTDSHWHIDHCTCDCRDRHEADNRRDAEADEHRPQPDSHRGQPWWRPSRDDWRES